MNPILVGQGLDGRAVCKSRGRPSPLREFHNAKKIGESRPSHRGNRLNSTLIDSLTLWAEPISRELKVKTADGSNQKDCEDDIIVNSHLHSYIRSLGHHDLVAGGEYHLVVG